MATKYYEWDGYCPESFLQNKKIRMRLNRSDFFESEETGLQVCIPAPGVQAVIMNFRGKGEFRESSIDYADKQSNFEYLAFQN